MKTNVSCSTMKATNIKHRIPFSNKTLYLRKLNLSWGPIGESTWTDGTNVYFSWSASTCAMLTKDGWNDNYTMDTDINGQYVWTDGTNIYHSSGSRQHVLDKETGKWAEKAWNVTIDGRYVWTDGTDIYYAFTHVLRNGIWEEKVWNCPAKFIENTAYTDNIWTDNENIYCSGGSVYSYILDKSTSTWTEKSWNISISGDCVWTDGFKTYYERGSDSYVLNKKTGEWEEYTWEGHGIYYGQRSSYTDGVVIYDEDCIILPLSAKTYVDYGGSWTEIGSFSDGFVFSINGVKYYSEKGMNWQTWVESEYNTAGYVIDAEEGVLWYGAECQVLYSGNTILGSAEIISGGTYTHNTG